MKTRAVIIALFVAVFLGQAAQAQTNNKITVQTDRDYYEFDNPVIIVISGNVSNDILRSGEQVVIQVYNPNGVLYRVDFANVTETDGSYDYELKLGGGGMMFVAGEYRVVATYRGQYQAETTFGFEGETIRDHLCAITVCTYKVTVSNVTHTIYYRASGSITNVTADIDRKSLILEVSTPERNSGLLMALPRTLIEAIDVETGNDSKFMIFVDGQEIAYDDIPHQAREYNLYLGTSENPEDYRILTGINFGRESMQIEIIGTWVAPELGYMSAVVLTALIAAIVMWTRSAAGTSFRRE